MAWSSLWQSRHQISTASEISSLLMPILLLVSSNISVPAFFLTSSPCYLLSPNHHLNLLSCCPFYNTALTLSTYLYYQPLVSCLYSSFLWPWHPKNAWATRCSYVFSTSSFKCGLSSQLIPFLLDYLDSKFTMINTDVFTLFNKRRKDRSIMQNTMTYKS